MLARRRVRLAVAVSALLAAAAAVAVANVALLAVASSPADDVGSLSARLDVSTPPATGRDATAATTAPAAATTMPDSTSDAVTSTDGDHDSDD